MRKLNDWQAKKFLTTYKDADAKYVLDIGAGARSVWKDFFPHVTTLDIAAEKKPDVVGDVHALPLEDSSFDIVICAESFEHFHNPFLAASEDCPHLETWRTVTYYDAL